MSKANLCSQDVSLIDEMAKRDGEICKGTKHTETEASNCSPCNYFQYHPLHVSQTLNHIVAALFSLRLIPTSLKEVSKTVSSPLSQLEASRGLCACEICS